MPSDLPSAEPAHARPALIKIADEALLPLQSASGTGLDLALDARGALVGILLADGPSAAEAIRSAARELADLRPLAARSLEELAGFPPTETHAAAFGLEVPLPSRRLNATQRLIVVATDMTDDAVTAAGDSTLGAVDVLLVRAEDGSVAFAPEQRWRFARSRIAGALRALRGTGPVPAEEPLPAPLRAVDTRLRSFGAWLARHGICARGGSHIALAAMIGLFGWVFGRLVLRQHAAFGTGAFDLGIFDQAVWLLSRGESFVTLNGFHVFGERFSPLLYLFAAVYRVLPDVRVLLLAQVLAVALGALAVFGLTRAWWRSHWWSLVAAAAYLLHPATQWAVWDQFHPSVFAIPLGLAALWAGMRERWLAFGAFMLLLLCTREEAALLALGIGVWVALSRPAEDPPSEPSDATAPRSRRDRRIAGWLTAALSLAWFAVAVGVLIPRFSGGESARLVRELSLFGATAGGVLRGVFTHPALVWDAVARSENLELLGKLAGPLAFVPLAAPALLAVALPALAVNILAGDPYRVAMQYHHTAFLLPPLFAALALGLARLGRTPLARYIAAVVVLIAAVAANAAWSPSPLSDVSRQGYWAEPKPRHEVVREAIAMIPQDASVSAYYQYVPHLAHREKAFLFPTPFLTEYWGISGEGAPDPDTVRYILVDEKALPPRTLDLVSGLRTSGDYEVLLDKQGILLLERTDGS